jgi:hypothetical protein
MVMTTPHMTLAHVMTTDMTHTTILTMTTTISIILNCSFFPPSALVILTIFVNQQALNLTIHPIWSQLTESTAVVIVVKGFQVVCDDVRNLRAVTFITDSVEL